MTAPAGWYPDPHDPTQRRYWDGASWTDRLVPADLPEPTVELPATAPPANTAAPAPLSASGPGGGNKPWHQRTWVWVVAGLAVLFVIIGAVSGNADTKPAADKRPTPSETVTVTPDPAPAATATVTVHPTPTKRLQDRTSVTTRLRAGTRSSCPTR
jgi:hypothetical protein